MSSSNTLNYISFFTLYVISFAYMFRINTGIVALGTLTVVHTAFTFFIGNSISSKLWSPTVVSSGITIMTLLTILLSSIMNMVGLILLMMVFIGLQKRYSETVGTPINLTKDYQQQYDRFKNNFIWLFIIISTLFYLQAFKPESNQYQNIIMIILALTTMGLSIDQLVIAAYLTRLKNRVVLYNEPID